MKLYFAKPHERINSADLKGYDGIYICASKGRNEHPFFDENYETAKASGLKIGFYHRFEAPTFKKNWTLESCKEGRAFGGAIRGISYDLDLCIDFADGLFDSGNTTDALPTIFYNALNGFTQKLDLYLDEPVNESNKLIVRAHKRQMEYIEQRKANRKYQLMISE